MAANSAGRMYFYLGSPNSQYKDFIEFTVGADVFNGNTTRVDGFGLKLALRLHSHDGYDPQVGEDQATFEESRAATFQRFERRADRVQGPRPGRRPVRHPLAGQRPRVPAGRKVRELLHRLRASRRRERHHRRHLRLRRHAGRQPALCAALNRHVAQLPPAAVEPGQFYQAAPANYYAEFWHDNAINHLRTASPTTTTRTSPPTSRSPTPST